MNHDDRCELDDPDRPLWQGKSCECGSRAYPLCVGCRNGRHMQHNQTNPSTGKEHPMTDHQDQQQTEPPVPRYRLTLTIYGNTLDEIADELLTQTRGGFTLDSDYGKRNAWHSTSGRVTSVMEHRNPEMTPGRYLEELHAWADDRRAQR